MTRTNSSRITNAAITIKEFDSGCSDHKKRLRSTANLKVSKFLNPNVLTSEASLSSSPYNHKRGSHKVTHGSGTKTFRPSRASIKHSILSRSKKGMVSLENIAVSTKEDLSPVKGV